MPKISKPKKKLIILGKTWLVTEVVNLIETFRYGDIKGVFFDDKNQSLVPTKNQKFKYYNDLSLLSKICKDNACNQIIITNNFQNRPNILKQLILSQEIGVEIIGIEELYASTKKIVPIKHIDNHWLTPSLMKKEFALGYYLIEILDYIMAILILLFALLVFPFISLLIKIDSKGPIFFIQERVGLNGKTFKMIKFRTMIDKADQKGTKWTVSGDKRITKIGKFLRKFRLDELPQIINVLKQDMNLVGPRPEAKELVDQFEKEIPFYHYRHLSKPGITGWAQVNYKNTSSIDGAIRKLEYDLFWVKRRSPILFIRTIFKTIKVVLTGFGSV